MKGIIAVIFLALISLKSFACSCVSQPDDIQEAVSQAYENADSVFIGQVESVNEAKVADPYSGGSPDFLTGEVTEFSVVQSWKGSHAKQIFTRIITQCCMCGISFKKGEKYLLYVYGPNKDGFYTTSMCTRTGNVKNASEDIRVLDTMPNKAKQSQPSAAGTVKR